MGSKNLTYLGRVMVEKILAAKIAKTEEEAIKLILEEWDSKQMQEVLHGYSNL